MTPQTRSPRPQIIASKLDGDAEALAALRASCHWCSAAAGNRAQRMRLPYHPACGNRMPAARMERARQTFPGVSHLELDCAGMSTSEEQPLLRGYEPQLGPRVGGLGEGGGRPTRRQPPLPGQDSSGSNQHQ